MYNRCIGHTHKIFSKPNVYGGRVKNPTMRMLVCLDSVKIAVNNGIMEELFDSLESGISLFNKRINDPKAAGAYYEEYRMETDEEMIEQLLGVSFVVAQTYITSIRNNFIMLSEVCLRDSRSNLSFISTKKAYELLKLHSSKIDTLDYTAIEIINSVANYWKHRDDWPTKIISCEQYEELIWDRSEFGNNELKTLKIVEGIGMSPSSTDNLRNVSKMIGVVSYEDLSPIWKLLNNWANSIYLQAQSEIRANVSSKG